jgi:N-terminal acetyltransferase B complex catalytic subunit
MARWPDLFYGTTSYHGSLMGYIMGKAEGTGQEWHGHVTALTVSPNYRRLGMAKQFMHILESVSDEVYRGYFVDLFVRKSNALARGMYEQFGYTVYRRVLNYYSGSALTQEEDALDMRKSLSRDPDKKSMIPLSRPVEAWEVS